MAEKAVIIGAGHAGGILAQQLARAGDAFEITLVGEEAWPPYERPPLSKQLLMGDIEKEKTFLRPADFYEKKGINIRLGVRATGIDRAAQTVSLSDGSNLPYDRLALCTGAQLRRLNIPGSDLNGIHYIRSIDDTLRIQTQAGDGARVVVVGGGYIGLEAAAALTKCGCKVKVIEMMDRVMARAVAEPLSRFYEEQHQARGVEIMLNTGVSEFEGDGTISAVIDDQGNRHECDLAIVGIGVIQDIELAVEAGLETDGSIVVDERARTSDPRISAAGDCTSHPNAILGRRLKLESVQNAVDQARCIANEWQDKGADYSEVPWFWSDQFDMKLQIAGLPDATDQVVVRGRPSMDGFSLFYMRDGKVTGVNAVNVGGDYVRGRKWIGEGRAVDPARLADTSIPIKEV
jgi:3-phenylpropionate/trans-cinnamate dioxygenase ferredoxin reductase subunit